jgi:hypothetical protein
VYPEDAYHINGDDEYWDWDATTLAIFQRAIKLPLSGVRIKDD